MDAATMRAQVRRELEHIPNWPEPQNQLRMSYWLMHAQPGQEGPVPRRAAERA